MQDEARRRAGAFLRKNGMDPEGIDIAGGSDAFIADMERGLRGEPGSLKMIPTYVGVGREIPVGVPVIAIDAGGTNLRVCVVRFDEDRRPHIEDFSQHTMPGTHGRISRSAFFDTVAGYLAPVLGKADRIGFCFSYPTEILPNGDGRLIRFCKEVQVDGVEGELVGSGLLEAVAAAGGRRDRGIVLLNDTVATLLGGKAATAGRPYGSYIGFILGTGTNTCYIERNDAIRKLPGLDARGSMIVNIESGAYDGAPRGRIDLSFDAETTNPGEHRFEKMISGGYFGDLTLATLRAAAAEGLFTTNAAQALSALPGLATKDVNAFLDNPWGDGVLSRCCADGGDRLAVWHLSDGLFERAARLVAVNLTAVVRKSGGGGDPTLPVCITAEGTMFSKSPVFRRKLDYHVRTVMRDACGLYCEFIEVDNATLLGTAIAGLTGGM